MSWVHAVSADLAEAASTIGGKARGLADLHRLGLPVPPAFVVTTDACREFHRTGRLPEDLLDDVAHAVHGLEVATGRRFGGAAAPLTVSVRSGAATSMPGMMDTVLDVPRDQLARALETVFSSWHSPRAHAYRELNGIPHDLGTAAVVQAMVFGDRDERSGSGVAFSRDPTSGAKVPFGDVLFRHRGDDVVSGRIGTRPLPELADQEPSVWAQLIDALDRIEQHLRDACCVEFTYESGHLWFLQVRAGRFTGRAAIQAAVDLVQDGLIDRREALLRITPHDVRHARTPRLVLTPDDVVLSRGVGACPGVATGRVATTPEAAVQLAAEGAVILARPETSPLDMRGLAAARGVLTTRGGPASHAAVVARAMSKPAVVGAAGLTVAPADGVLTGDGRIVRDGTVVTLDGTTGQVVLGTPAVAIDDPFPHLDELLGWADDTAADHTGRSPAHRLRAAHTALRSTAER